MKLGWLTPILSLILMTFTAEASEVSEEKFVLVCDATVTDSGESLTASAKITITERPTSAGLGLSYELLNLPYRAEVKIDFLEGQNELRWKMFFIDIDNSEEFGRAEATISPIGSELLIISKTADFSKTLKFACNIRSVP